MSYPLPVRLLVAALVSLGLGVLLVLLLYASELGLSVWRHLQEAPPWFLVAYLVGLGAVLAAGAWVLWRILLPQGRKASPDAVSAAAPPPSEEAVSTRLADAEAKGADVASARRELDELQTRRAAGDVYVALLGEVSTGKTSIVRALLPDAVAQTGAEVDPRSGTTRSVVRYTWTSPAGDRLTLTDLPGLNEPGEVLSDTAREEALRAHVVVYLADGDLTRDQYQALQSVLALAKPVVLALNKMDLYTSDTLAAIRRRLEERLGADTGIEVVAVSAGGRREVVRVGADGRERSETRELPPRVDALVAALQRRLDDDPEVLERLRDSAVFVLAERKLDASVAAHRREKAEQLIAEHTRKAVLGALAAVSPGADLVIQGYFGTRLVTGLCEIYEIPAHRIGVDRFLSLAATRVGKALPLTLAMAGNVLKAFPGIGTITGGLAHAVAYGLLFDSLGRAVAETLQSHGTLVPEPALKTFEETIGDDLESRARRLVHLAVAGQGRADSGRD